MAFLAHNRHDKIETGQKKCAVAHCLTALETSILKEGVRDAIVTWNDFIIDGHNRYEIATRHGLPYNTISKEFDSEDEVKEWMILNQFGRRNLNSYQRSILAIPLGEIIARRAKENHAIGVMIGASITNRSVQKSAQSGFQEKPITKPVITPINATKEMAKIANVSHDTIAKVHYLHFQTVRCIKIIFAISVALLHLLTTLTKIIR